MMTRRTPITLTRPENQKRRLSYLANTYRYTRYGFWCMRPEMAFKNCGVVALHFCRHALRHGVTARVVELRGLPTGSSERFWPRETSRSVNHFVTELFWTSEEVPPGQDGGLLVDWTVRQLRPDAELPAVTTWPGDGPAAVAAYDAGTGFLERVRAIEIRLGHHDAYNVGRFHRRKHSGSFFEALMAEKDALGAARVAALMEKYKDV